MITISQSLGGNYAGRLVTLSLIKKSITISATEAQLFTGNDVYFDQINTDSDGKYSFSFVKPVGTFDLSVKVAGVSGTFTEEATFYASESNSVEINITELGHIFYNYSDIQIPVTVKVTESVMNSSITAKFKVSQYRGSEIDGKGFEGDEIYLRDFPVYIDQSGCCSDIFNIDLSESPMQFGIFSLNCEVYNGDNLIASDETRFSVVNTPQIGVLNEKLGTQTHMVRPQTPSYYGSGYVNEVLNLFAKSGFGTIRQGVYWQEFERQKNKYTLNKTQENYYGVMNENHISPLVIITGHNALYRSKNPVALGSIVELDDQYNETYTDAFGENAYNTVLKVREYAPDTHDFEIFNEYNIEQFNILNDDGTIRNDVPKVNSTPEGYVNLLKAAYPKIHSADEDAVVYGMATAHIVGDPRSNYSTYDWIEQVLKLGGGDYMDAISVHIYTQNCIPEAVHNNIEPLYNKAQVLDKYREIVDKYKPGMPIVVSELGYSSTGTIASLNGSSSTPEELQAKYALRDIAIIYNKVDRLIWFTSIDVPHASEYEHYLGIIRMENSWVSSDGTVSCNADIPFEAKPTLLALSNFNALLSNATLVQENYNSDNSVYDYVFETPDCREIHMMWTTNRQGITKTFNFPRKKLTKYDMYGNRTVLTSTDNNYTIALTDEPIYIETFVPYEVSFSTTHNVLINRLTDFVDNVVIDIEVNDDSIADACFSVATYGSQSILMDFKPIYLSEGQGNITLNAKDVNIIKVFAFEDFVNIKPVAPVKYIKRETNY